MWEKCQIYYVKDVKSEKTMLSTYISRLMKFLSSIKLERWKSRPIFTTKIATLRCDILRDLLFLIVYLDFLQQQLLKNSLKSV